MGKELFDHSKLKGRCKEKGETLDSLSKKLGLSSKALSNKWNGKSCFTDIEIYALKSILDIDEVDLYFFTPKV